MTYQDKTAYDSKPACDAAFTMVWKTSWWPFDAVVSHSRHQRSSRSLPRGKSCVSTRLCCWNVWHNSFICVTWLIHMCDMTHLFVWHASIICVTCLNYMCDMTHSYVWHASFICVTCLIHTCDMPDSYMWHAWFIHVTCLIHTCDMPDSYMWHAWFIHATWLIHTCDMPHSAYRCSVVEICDTTHSYVWHDSFICVTWLIYLCDMPHSEYRCSVVEISTDWDFCWSVVFFHFMHRLKILMGWLMLVGPIKLWVSFAKEPYKRDDILQNRPII